MNLEVVFAFGGPVPHQFAQMLVGVLHCMR